MAEIERTSTCLAGPTPTQARDFMALMLAMLSLWCLRIGTSNVYDTRVRGLVCKTVAELSILISIPAVGWEVVAAALVGDVRFDMVGGELTVMKDRVFDLPAFIPRLGCIFP